MFSHRPSSQSVAPVPSHARNGLVVGGVLVVVALVVGSLVYMRVKEPPPAPTFTREGMKARTKVVDYDQRSMSNGVPASAVKTTSTAPAVVVKPPLPTPTPSVERPKPPAVVPVKRPPMYFVSHERKASTVSSVPLYKTAAWHYIPCVLENILNSEIEGMFTVKTTRPVLDVTGTHILIPQGQRIGAKDESAQLLFGNSRIPTWGLSLSMPDGELVDLGNAPIMDATGTNGLTGEVNNHTWRIVWTSVLIEGLQLGQQAMNQSIASQGDGITVSGVGQYSSGVARQRLGRAQDTRPTIEVASGQQCVILVPKALSLPSLGLASR